MIETLGLLSALGMFVCGAVTWHFLNRATAPYRHDLPAAFPANDSNKIERGIAAQHLLENAMFRQALNDLDSEYHAAWHEAKTVAAREDCHRYVTLIPKLVEDLQSIMTTGNLEQRRLDELQGSNTRKLWQTK